MTTGKGVMKKHDGKIIDHVNGYNIIECYECKFKHVYPYPPANKQIRFYSHSFFEDRKEEVNYYHQDLDWWRMHYNRRLDWIEEILPGKGRLLDIGCGLGYFMAEAKKRGWETMGIEPSIKAAKEARGNGLGVFRGVINDTTYEGFKNYDVVYIANVLEHISDPIKLLCHVALMIRPNGILFVVVPNDYNTLQIAAQKHLNCHKWWVRPPDHLNYFSGHSIEMMIKSIGFNVHSRFSTFPIELFLLAGINYIGDSKLGRQAHEYRKKAEMAIHNAGLWEIVNRLYHYAHYEGWGRGTEILARR